MFSKIVLPASILAGTVIGAGMFSLPFVFKSVGLSTGFFYLILFSLIYIFIYFFYADLMIRSGGEHRLLGCARIYWGEKGFWAAFFVNLIQLFFVLTIYLVLAPSFLKLFIGGKDIYYILFFWILGSFIILSSTKRIALSEFLITGGMITIIFLVFLMGFKNFFSFSSDFSGFDLSNFFAAGPILFSLAGALAVPEILRYFKESRIPLSYLKTAIIGGSILPVIVYGAFIVGILGLSPVVSEDSVSALVGVLPPFFLALMGILGFLSLISSYIIIGLNIRRVLKYDVGLSGWLSRTLTIFVPIGLYFIGFQNFIRLVSFTGAVFLPLESIFIILIWLKADKKSSSPSILITKSLKLLSPLIILMFFAVFLYAIINN